VRRNLQSLVWAATAPRWQGPRNLITSSSPGCSSHSKSPSTVLPIPQNSWNSKPRVTNYDHTHSGDTGKTTHITHINTLTKGQPMQIQFPIVTLEYSSPLQELRNLVNRCCSNCHILCRLLHITHPDRLCDPRECSRCIPRFYPGCVNYCITPSITRSSQNPLSKKKEKEENLQCL